MYTILSSLISGVADRCRRRRRAELQASFDSPLFASHVQLDSRAFEGEIHHADQVRIVVDGCAVYLRSQLTDRALSQCNHCTGQPAAVPR